MQYKYICQDVMKQAPLYGFSLIGNEGKLGFAESSNLSGNNDSVGLKWRRRDAEAGRKG